MYYNLNVFILCNMSILAQQLTVVRKQNQNDLQHVDICVSLFRVKLYI